MSFVGLNSIIYSIKDDTEGTKIIDLHNLFEYMQKEKIPMSLLKSQDKKDESKYPYECYKYLFGFSTYDDTEFYLVERMGYEYSKDDFLKFWKNISKYCEPFYFYHSPSDSCKPKTVFDVEHDKDIYFYKVVCVNAKVEVHKLEVSVNHG